MFSLLSLMPPPLTFCRIGFSDISLCTVGLFSGFPLDPVIYQKSVGFKGAVEH